MPCRSISRIWEVFVRLLKFYQTSIGKKYVVAISGGGLFLFLVAHMLGNMWVYGGAEEIDSYSHHLSK